MRVGGIEPTTATKAWVLNPLNFPIFYTLINLPCLSCTDLLKVTACCRTPRLKGVKHPARIEPAVPERQSGVLPLN